MEHRGPVARNVANLADAPTTSRNSRTMSVWTSDELRAFIDAISDHYLYLLAATTGMRRAELAGLVWRDVDLDTARLTVSEQQLSVEYQLIESDLKTPTSRRTIDLDLHTGLPWILRHVYLRELEPSDSDTAPTIAKCSSFEQDPGQLKDWHSQLGHGTE